MSIVDKVKATDPVKPPIETLNNCPPTRQPLERTSIIPKREMDISIRIVTGDEAFTLIAQDVFIAAWDTLCRNADKVTAFQEPAFVVSWYAGYADQFCPVVCAGYDEHNVLVGLMPLAVSKKDGSLTHAGADQALYQGWIARGDVDQWFAVACMLELKKVFKLKQWQWGWVAPGSNTGWLQSPQLAKNNIYTNVKRHQSPLWDLSDGERLQRLLSQKSIRAKREAYQRRGRFYVERVWDEARGRQLLQVFMKQYEFKCLALYGRSPFAEDPNRARFWEEKMRFLNKNHFTVLWSDTKPVAFLLGVCDRDTVCVQLSSFDPIEWKNSPVVLLRAELAVFMLAEGFRFLDSTPAGEYKGRCSNKKLSVVRPVFYFNRRAYLRGKIREVSLSVIWRGLRRAGLNSKLVRQKYESVCALLHKLRTKSVQKTIEKCFSALYRKHVYLHYKLLSKDFKAVPAASESIRAQQYADLLSPSGDPRLKEAKYVMKTLRRISHGEILYSVVKNDELAHYGWVSRGPKVHRGSDMEIEGDIEIYCPAEGVMIYDGFTSPKYRRQGLAQKTLTRMLYDSFKTGATQAIIGAEEQNIASRTAIEKFGFKPFHACIFKKFLCFSWGKVTDGEAHSSVRQSRSD